jgi:hypothetical protein
MGLDMYMTPLKKRKGIYWRKANAIHNYIVQKHAGGVDECQRIVMSREDIRHLADTCTAVVNDRSLAPDLLPTTEGFFFGDTDYDDWYFEQLEHTERELNAMLEKDDWDFMEYQASW